jgi:hypothetical protein
VYYQAHLDVLQTCPARRLRNPERLADLTADVFLAAIDDVDRYQAAVRAVLSDLDSLPANERAVLRLVAIESAQGLDARDLLLLCASQG